MNEPSSNAAPDGAGTVRRQPDSTRLASGAEIPRLGFGVFQIAPEDTEAAVLHALEIGYRHIDGAQGYRNEAQVRAAIDRSGVDPANVFVTSKLSNAHRTADEARHAIDESVAVFGDKQIDLFLIHWPLATVRDFMVVWRAITDAYDAGAFRAIGVSNFHRQHLERLFAESDHRPDVNQIEVHPYLVQEELRAFNRAHDIVTEAWSPIGQGIVLDDPEICAIAAATGRTPAQVVIRWHLQLGTVVFPRSTSPVRIRENFAATDGPDLTDEQLRRISALDRHQRTGGDPDTFRYKY